MRLIRFITTLAVIFVIAFGLMQVLGCGASSKRALTPLEAVAAGKAPWNKLPKAEQAAYASCGDATVAIDAVKQRWKMMDPAEVGAESNPQPIPGSSVPRALEYKSSPDGSGSMAALEYRMENGKRVDEYAFIVNFLVDEEAGTLQIQENIILDYNIKRALDTGELSPRANMEDLLAPAEGKFFCFYP